MAAVAQGQTLRDGHRLVEASEQFRICARAGCPQVVQGDCTTWLAELDRTVPTVVFSAKDRSGNDVVDATVTVDGKVLATKLDGEAIPLDPGAHTFGFRRADGSSATRDVLIKEGDKARSLEVVFAGSGAGTTPRATTPAPAQQHGVSPGVPETSRPLRVLGWILGGAGVVAMGVGTGVGFAAHSKDQTAEGEPGLARQTDSRTAVQQANVATAVFVAGAAVAAAGVVLWLLPAGSPAAVGTNGQQIIVGGTF